MAWQLHFLNARGQLDRWRPAVEEGVEKVRRRCARVLESLPVVDIVVRAEPGGAIAEIGHVGQSPAPGVIFLTLDPTNPALVTHMGAAFERMVAHEVHHALRWDGPGYGESLGEALVSEGLAGQFVRQLFQNPPEPWERAVQNAALRDAAGRARAQWDATDYGHARWFYGRGDLGRWTGYALGYRLAGLWLTERPGRSAADAAREPAGSFRPLLDRLAALGC